MWFPWKEDVLHRVGMLFFPIDKVGALEAAGFRPHPILASILYSSLGLERLGSVGLARAQDIIARDRLGREELFVAIRWVCDEFLSR